ncbi:hypothetical protein ACT7CZ_08375 [Bacillus cereus]
MSLWFSHLSLKRFRVFCTFGRCLTKKVVGVFIGFAFIVKRFSFRAPLQLKICLKDPKSLLLEG